MLCRWHFGDESPNLDYSVLLIGADTQATNTGNMGIINRQNRKAKERYRKAWEQAVYAFKAHPSAGPSSLIYFPDCWNTWASFRCLEKVANE